MNKKITWGVIYDDFKDHYPRLSKKAVDYRPHDYLTIKIWFDEEPLAMTYDYMTKRCVIVPEDWQVQ